MHEGRPVRGRSDVVPGDRRPRRRAGAARRRGSGAAHDYLLSLADRAAYARHVRRLDPWPAEVVAVFDRIERDPTVHHTMNGPSEFHAIGSIRDWQAKDRLAEIRVPTLLVSGRHDEATPALRETLRDGIAGAEWVLFEASSQMPHVEERERSMDVVAGRLARHD